MEVNEECVSSFLNDLENFVDFSRVPNQDLANQSDQDVIQTLYNFANNTIYGERRNVLAMPKSGWHSMGIIEPHSIPPTINYLLSKSHPCNVIFMYVLSSNFH